MNNRSHITTPEGRTEIHQSSFGRQLKVLHLDDGVAVVEIDPGHPALRTSAGYRPAKEDSVKAVVASYPVGSEVYQS